MPASASERAALAKKQAADRAEAARKAAPARAAGQKAMAAMDERNRASNARPSAVQRGLKQLGGWLSKSGGGGGRGRPAGVTREQTKAPTRATAPARTTPLPPARQTTVKPPSVPYGGGGAAARGAIANRAGPTVTVTAKQPVGSLPKGTGRIPPPSLSRPAAPKAAPKPKGPSEHEDWMSSLSESARNRMKASAAARAKK